MKRKIGILLTLAVILSLAVFAAAADSIQILVNGYQVYFPDAQPFVDASNRIQVPVRFVSQALGGEVDWDQKTQTVTITRGKDRITLTLGEKAINVNGTVKTLDTEATAQDSRTFVPLRFVSEALGAEVQWDSSKGTATIDLVESDSSSTVEMINRFGYLVPKDSNIGVGPASGDDNMEAILTVNILVEDFDQQIEDLYTAFKSKFGETVAAQIRDHVKQKNDRWYPLPEKFIYLPETDQYIWIQSSRASNISIYVCIPGYRDWGWNL